MFGIVLDRKIEIPLKRQIYERIRELITNGELKAGDILVSTRELADILNVSRSTVVEAYEMLIAEGYVQSRQGAPTRVSDGLTIEKTSAAPAGNRSKPHRILKADFSTGRPDLRLFPQYQWRQVLSKASRELPTELYGYTGPEGLLSLRSEIAAWLKRSRGFSAREDDIFITAGATHALYLLTELLCSDKSAVLMEDPCHSGLLHTFVGKRRRIIPAPVDASGMQTWSLPQSGEAGAVYVTPSHQFPLGGILPAARRAALVRYAREKNIYIIEDDYDSEFRYAGDPVAPLAAMGPQRVVYVGTFSKVFFPALRIGYVILPAPLHARWRDLRTHTDIQNPPFSQAALAEFIRSGKLESHIRKMRRTYGRRREALLDALKENFGSNWTAYGDNAGLHIAIDFSGMRFDEAFRRFCLKNGIFVTPLETHCIEKGRHESKLMLGYGHLEPDEIHAGIKRLLKAVKEY